MTDIRPYTNEIAYRMFFDTADLNYIGAREAFFQQRDWDFWWLTLHTVEKYLKTLLLVNGVSAKEGNHNIPKLLQQVRQLDSRLRPPAFVRPHVEGLDHWQTISDTGFIARLNEAGSAENRYGLYGYSLGLSDLFRADQLVFWARRHARPLTMRLSTGATFDWAEALDNQPAEWVHRRGPLDRTAALTSHDPRRWPLSRLNAAFFPGKRHRVKGWRASATNPPLSDWARRLEEVGRGGGETHRTAREVIQWAIDNIKLNKSDRAELQRLIDRN